MVAVKIIVALRYFPLTVDGEPRSHHAFERLNTLKTVANTLVYRLDPDNFGERDPAGACHQLLWLNPLVVGREFARDCVE